MATVVGMPRPKISIGIRMKPPPAPSSPARKPTKSPTAKGMNIDMLSIPDTGKEM